MGSGASGVQAARALPLPRRPAARRLYAGCAGPRATARGRTGPGRAAPGRQARARRAAGRVVGGRAEELADPRHLDRRPALQRPARRFVHGGIPRRRPRARKGVPAAHRGHRPREARRPGRIELRHLPSRPRGGDRRGEVPVVDAAGETVRQPRQLLRAARFRPEPAAVPRGEALRRFPGAHRPLPGAERFDDRQHARRHRRRRGAAEDHRREGHPAVRGAHGRRPGTVGVLGADRRDARVLSRRRARAADGRVPRRDRRNAGAGIRTSTCRRRAIPSGSVRCPTARRGTRISSRRAPPPISRPSRSTVSGWTRSRASCRR